MATLLECVRGCDLSGSYASTCLDACVKLTSQLNLKNNIGDDSGFDGLSLEWSLAIAIVLVPLSGLFAGLTLGLLSLDLVGLRVRPLQVQAIMAIVCRATRKANCRFA